MENITELSAENCDIKDLTGLEYCTNLRKLSMPRNKISNLSSLANLYNLNYIYLDENQISDISSLKNLRQLDYICIRKNNISDLSPLANLTNLNCLALPYNQISDISPIQNLTKIDELWLNANEISDVSALAGMKEVVRLVLIYNNIFDISPLANLTNLQELYVNGQKVPPIETVHHGSFTLYNITSKPYDTAGGVYNSNSHSVTWSKLPEHNLNLQLKFDNVVGVNGVIPFSEKLILRLTYIEDEALNNLIHTTLNKEPLEAIYKSDLEKITSLDASNLGITSLKGIESLINLESLKLSYNQISDLSPLRNLKKLTNLDLNHNEVFDVHSLTNLTKLKTLNLENNNISEISPLSKLTQLTSLSLNNNKISDFSNIRDIKSLNCLYLNNCDISDISPLAKLTKLQRANVSNQVVNSKNYYTNNKVAVKNIITSADGSLCTDITSNGEYKNNSIFWTDIDKDTALTYNFTDNKDNRINFSGKVMIDVKHLKDYITDENLCTGILKSLNKDLNDCVSQEELDNIKTLNLSDNNISSITGIELLRELKNLDLSKNHIVNISILKSLKNLVSADISSQTYAFTEQKTNLSHINTSVVNPVISYEGKAMTSVKNISNDGTYIARTNKISWKNISESATLSYDFEETITLLNGGQCIFTGTVSKKVIFK